MLLQTMEDKLVTLEDKYIERKGFNSSFRRGRMKLFEDIKNQGGYRDLKILGWDRRVYKQ